MALTCCQGGCEGGKLWNEYLSPDEVLRQKYAGNFYRENRTVARVVFFIPALISGLIKGLLFPVIAVIMLLAHTLMAIINFFRGKPDAPHWQAAAISFVEVSACVVFFVLSAYYLRIATASAIYMTGVAISVVVHVYRSCKDPESVKIPEDRIEGNPDPVL